MGGGTSVSVAATSCGGGDGTLSVGFGGLAGAVFAWTREHAVAVTARASNTAQAIDLMGGARAS